MDSNWIGQISLYVDEHKREVQVSTLIFLSMYRSKIVFFIILFFQFGFRAVAAVGILYALRSVRPVSSPLL